MKKALSLIGNTLHVLYFILELCSFCESDGKQSWRLMLLSLLFVVLCEIAYVTEAIWSVCKEVKVFNIVKLLAIILSALILYNFAYYGKIKMIICNAYMLLLLILQIISLVINSKCLKNQI